MQLFGAKSAAQAQLDQIKAQKDAQKEIITLQADRQEALTKLQYEQAQNLQNYGKNEQEDQRIRANLVSEIDSV